MQPTSLKIVDQFKCLADKCPDTCCRSWDIQVDTGTCNKFRQNAPELLNAIKKLDEGIFVMKKDDETGFCHKFQDNLCSIHRDYGEDYLPKVCSQYPRKTEDNIKFLYISCPESARLTLDPLHDFSFTEKAENTELLQLFFEAINKEQDSRKLLAKFSSIAKTLDNLNRDTWVEAIKYYLEQEPLVAYNNVSSDSTSKVLLYFIIILKNARQKSATDLMNILETICKFLKAEVDFPNASILTSNATDFNYKEDPRFGPILKQYLKIQLLVNGFPFNKQKSNFLNFSEIIIRFSLVKLILNADLKISGSTNQARQAELIQQFSRFFDHLKNQKLSQVIIEDFGWNLESNLAQVY